MIEFEYPMTEVFHSIQGEGAYVGKRMTFIRFALCNYKCRWCDTDFGQRFKGTAGQIAAKANAITPAGTMDVCLTGGEPTLYDLLPIIDHLLLTFDRVHIETNGSMPQKIEWIKATYGDRVWVTVSPKKSDGDPVWEWEGPGDELKLVHQEQDLDRFKITGERLFLQPLWSDNPMTRVERLGKVIEAMEGKPEWELSTQIHKLIEMP